MSVPSHKPPSKPIGSVSSSEEDEDDEEEEEEQGEEEFHNDDNDTDDGDYEDGDNDDGNFDDGQEYTYSEPSSLGPPSPPPPSSETSPTLPSSKWAYQALSQIFEIATIYLKFAIITIIIYSIAIWYAMHFGDVDSAKSESVASNANDISDSDTCPAGLPA